MQIKISTKYLNMEKLLSLLLLVFVSVQSPKTLYGQSKIVNKTETSTVELTAPIPTSNKVKVGAFKNGLTYYIRHNEEPKNRLELRLVVNAGSNQEKPNQLGMAHLVEHMNFNGTKHFKKNELVDYLQSIGVKFGADLNASTSFDHTIYILSIPIKNEKEVNKGLQILADWAHNTLLKHDMIESERHVVLEEYRMGLGAGKRMRRQYLPIILKGSRYAKRLPIGTKQSILHSTDHSLRTFYHQWYRPGLEAIIAVGDMPMREIYQEIKKHFADIPTFKKPRKKKEYSIPNHQKTYIAVASDSEATISRVKIVYMDKGSRQPFQTIRDYRYHLVNSLCTFMINNRLNEKTNKPNPPFISAGSSYSIYWSPRKKAYTISAVASEDRRLRAMKALLLVDKRAKKYGFLKDEFIRAKKALLSSLENSYKRRKTRSSTSYAESYISNYLYNIPIPGIRWRYEKAQKIVPNITLKQVNSVVDDFLHKSNRSVLFTGPPLKSSKDALKQKIQNLLAEVATQRVSPYQEKNVRDHLMRTMPKMGSIVNKTINDSLGTTRITLSNGAKVIYKKTDFKNNQILFHAFSFGGTSLYSNAAYRQTVLATGGLTQAGLAGLSKSDLKKVLAGKNVSVSPYISSLTEGLRGHSTKKDMETMFQLIYLYFTSLNKNPKAFQSYISKLKTVYANRLSSPKFYFKAKFSKYLNGQNNPRYVGIPTPEKLAKANYNLAYKKYQQRFANAGDFTFYFIGDIPVSAFKKYLKIYLASLPSTNEHEMYRVLPYRPLSGSHKKVIYKGEAPKSFVELIYDGETSYSSKEDLELQILGDILTIELTNDLREKDSGVYTASASGGMIKIPYGLFQFIISFPCGPDNVPKLIKSALQQVDEIIQNGPTIENLEKVKKHKLLTYKKSIKTNRYWLSNLIQSAINQTNKTTFLHFKSNLNAITRDDIQQIAKEYLIRGHITGTLYPEKKNPENK